MKPAQITTIPFETQESKIREIIQKTIVQHMKDNRGVRDEDGDNVVAMVAARSAIIAGILTMTAPIYDPQGGEEHAAKVTQHVIDIIMEFTAAALAIISNGEINFNTHSMVVTPTDSATVIADKVAKFSIVPTEH